MELIGKPDLQRALVSLLYTRVKVLTLRTKGHILIQIICIRYYGNVKD